MIENDHTGSALTAAFDTRIAARYLDAARKHNDVVIFGREVNGTWYNTDISDLFISSNTINLQMADQYGTSSAMEVDFMFVNTPIARTRSAYSGGVTIDLWDYQSKYLIQVDDWIRVGDFDNYEYRRVAGVSTSNGVITTITLGEALDNNYANGTTKVRYAFIINPDAERVDDYDVGVGTLKVRTGYADAAVNQYVTLYQATMNGIADEDDQSIAISTHDVIKRLGEYELVDPLEFDDRGIASVPTPNTTNDGNGEISDIRYNPNKIPDNFVTETLTFTYKEGAVFYEEKTYDTSGWDVSGSVSSFTIEEVLPDGESITDRIQPNQETLIEDIGKRVWTIDLLHLVGIAFDIREGDRRFTEGDTIRVYTVASGIKTAMKGRGYAVTPNVSITELNPSYIVEFCIETLAAIQHTNPETGTSTDLLDSGELTTLRTLAQDFEVFLRGGRFPEGTRLLEVIDNALRVAGFYLTTTPDDHLRIVPYTAAILENAATPITFSADYENTARTWNAWDIAAEPKTRNTVANRVRFRYDTQDEDKKVEVEDTTSQATYEIRKHVIRGNDFAYYELSTVFDVDRYIMEAAALRLLNRYKVPLATFTFTAHPQAMLLELGDIPLVYSRHVPAGNVRLFVTQIQKNIATREVRITGELATHIVGKFAKFVDDGTDPAVGAIWDSTGFIGNAGEERLGIFGDVTLELDFVGDNDATLEPRLGTPDQWGNHVEQGYILE